jgi:hypothetical protein
MAQKPTMEIDESNDESKDEIIKKLKLRLKKSNIKLFEKQIEIEKLKKNGKKRDEIIEKLENINKELLFKFEILNEIEDELNELQNDDENVLEKLNEMKQSDNNSDNIRHIQHQAVFGGRTLKRGKKKRRTYGMTAK